MREQTSETSRADPAGLITIRQPRQRRLASNAILTGVVAFVALLTGSLGLVISRMHERDLNSARQALESFDQLLDEQTASVFRGVSVVVEQVAEDIDARHLTDPDQLKAKYQDEATFRDLKRHSLDLPQLDALSIVAADGTVVALSRGYPVKPINLADRAYFQRVIDPASPVNFVTNPMINRGDNKTWDLYFVRRLALPDGKLLGLVLGAVKLSYFEDLYAKVGVTGPMALSLWRDDGTLLARFPPLPALLGQRYQRKADFAAMSPGEVRIAMDAIGADGERRLIVSRRLRDQNLIVDASQRITDILHDWRQDASIVALAGIISAAAGIVLSVLAIRQLRAYAALAEAVAEREAAERARLDAEERLVEAAKLEAIGRLTAGVAHDFNNLLSAILGNAELLQRGLAETPHLRRISLILDATQRGAAMIRQLLAFARKQQLSPELLDLNEIALNTIELVRGSIPPALSLTTDLAHDLPPAFADPVQIGNALLNLLVNARDATGEGGVITVTTNSHPEGAARRRGAAMGIPLVSIAVRDTGSGMSPEIMQRVFEPFFTTKSAGKGSGLGLSQVYGIAEQSGGFVELDSAPGAGTTVTLFLPSAETVPDRVSTIGRDGRQRADA